MFHVHMSAIPGGALCFIARLTLSAVGLAAFSLVFGLEDLQYCCKVGFGQLSTQKTHDTNKEHIMQHGYGW